MFQPYLAIFRQLFTCRNRGTVLDLTSTYFSAIALMLLTLKYVRLFEKKYLSPFPRYFQLVASMFVTNDMHSTSWDIHTKGAQTWSPQVENSVEKEKEFVLKQIYILVWTSLMQ
jgi:hypothetical protein